MSGTGPFARLRPPALVSLAYGAATLVWVIAGADLPGGRWFAVHLFTLGVVTNLVLALSDHFARTLTHRPGEAPWWSLVAANASIALVLWSVPNGGSLGVAIGATALSGVVVASYVRLRRLRKAALAPRFGWIVRAYERAHGAFLHGAVLGALVGANVLSGRWRASGRLAHLQVNLLGWAGLTLLATIVFFGPTIARVRIEEGADARARSALRIGATALGLGVLALLASAFEGALGVAFRWIAAAGLAILAWAVTVVCLPVARAMRRAKPGAGRWSVLATVAWFPLVAAADAAMVAAGAWRYADALGLVMLVGVIAQAIVASLGYLAPFLLGGPRETLLRRLAAGELVRVALWNAGVLAIALAAVLRSPAGGWLARIGWAAIVAALATVVVAVVSARVGSSRERVPPAADGGAT